MNAEHDLTEAYREWRRSAELAGLAINRGDWPQVTVCHLAIVRLQERITHLSLAVQRDWTEAGPGRSARAAIVLRTIQDLMALTRRNQALLAEKKQTVRLKLDQAGVACNNLRQIRRSYILNRPSVGSAFA